MLEVGKLAEVTAVHSTAGIMRCVIEEIGARIDSRATILDRSCKQKTSCVTIPTAQEGWAEQTSRPHLTLTEGVPVLLAPHHRLSPTSQQHVTWL